MIAALTIAALTVLPFIAYVAAAANAAHIGYQILHLTQDIAAIETEHERLQAIASSLRTPDRIERLATTRLGLQTPAAGQISTLVLTPAEDGQQARVQPGLWQRLGASFFRSEAAAPAAR